MHLLRLIVICVLAAGVTALGRGPLAARVPADGSPDALAWRVFLPMLDPPVAETAPVVVSPGRGFYDAPVRVTLNNGASGAVVYYTLDGTVPGPGNGWVYVTPLTIDRTTVLRAMAYHHGHPPSVVATHTYLFLDDVLRQSMAPTCRRKGDPNACFPPSWGVFPVVQPPTMIMGMPVPADYEMDPKVVGRTPALRDDLRALPSLSLVTAPEDMFDATRGIYANPMSEGASWERPASAELLLPDGQPGFQVDCGVRISGRWSRQPDSMAKHSFSLRFSSRYGPAKLHYPLFPGSPVSSFDSLRLRAGQADTFHYWPIKAQYIHDQWARDTQRDMGWLSATGVFVHLYVDGLYWGLYNLTEELTADFAADHRGGKAKDWDVIKEGHQVEDGNLTAYNELLALVAEGPPDHDRYQRAQAYLDLPQLADYHLLEIFGGNWDWPLNNWVVARDRVRGGGFQFLVWDMEHQVQLDTYGVDGSIADTVGVDGLHGWLKGSPEYRLLFGDRVQRHLFGPGALTPAANWQRYAALANAVEPGIAGESARWGDVVPGRRTFLENEDGWCLYLEGVCHQPCNWGAQPCPQTVDGQWRPERDRLRDVFFPQRTAVVVQQLCGQRLYPAVVPPSLDPPGGRQSGGVRLTIGRDMAEAGCANARSDGIVYYTLDGSDPREAWTGQPTRAARPYHGPVALPGYARVMARAVVHDVDGSLLWSAAVSGTYGLPRLVISELMYNPPAGDDHEWLELANLEPRDVDLSGMALSGITVTLPVGTHLGPSERLVLAANAAVFQQDHPGVAVAAQYTGKLSDKGERIAVLTADGTEVAAADYDDEGFWPLAPDGRGWSLVLDDLHGDPADPEAWRASALPGGSPGAADPPAPYRRVVVNEVLARASPPREGAIELYNPGDEPAQVGGWGLSDDLDLPFKHRLPADATVPPGAFLVVYEAMFRAEPIGPGFALDPRGGTVYLSSADGLGRPSGLMLGVTYSADDDGVSFGRYEGSGGLFFAALTRPTFGVDDPTTVAEFRAGTGAVNALPRVAPVAINEIMYHPLDVLPEYLELYNTTAAPIWLGDPARPDWPWQLAGAVKYTFPAGTVIAPGGYLVVTGPDPATARRVYDVPTEVAVLGPWQGKLDNAGEKLELLRPVDLGVLGVVPGVSEMLHYDRVPPWPGRADGLGPSLERLDVRRFAGDGGNWAALSKLGTAGRPNTVVWRTLLPLAVNGR
jgi:hypothetical protein